MLRWGFKKFLWLGLLFLSPISHAGAEVVYNRGNAGDLNTLDPHLVSTVQETLVMRDMFESLLDYDAKGNAIPGAAESWTISPDHLIYTFKIRQDAVWSNGDPLTADDFVYSLRRQEDPKLASKYSAILYPIKNAEEINSGKMPLDALGVRAVDTKTLEIVLKGPTPYFLELLTHTASFPVNKTVIEKYGADWVKPGNLVSNGAYVVAEFVPKGHIKLVKNPRFHDAKNVKIDVVNIIPLEDRAAALKRFEAGEIDSYNEIPAEQVAYIRNKLKDNLQLGPYLGTYYYVFRCDKPPFDNPRLRHALSLAVDREDLAEKIWGGIVLPGYSFVPPGIKGYTSSTYDFKTMSQLDREDEARKIMTELGYGPDKPLKLQLRYNTGEDHKNTAVALANMFKNIYVEASLINTDGKTHYDYLQSRGDFDLARVTWIADYKDPQTFLSLFETGNGNNYGNYSNKDVDALLRNAAVEGDAAKRMETLSKAEALMLHDDPMIVLLYYTYHDLVSKKLHGFEPNIIDTHSTRWMWKDQ